MREPQARREQREIVVPARSAEPRPRARRQPAAQASGRLAALTATGGTIGRAFLRHPGEILGVGVVLGAVSLICLNALGYQAGRHPAPIFPRSRRAGLRRPPTSRRRCGRRSKPLRWMRRRLNPPSLEPAKPEPAKPEPAKPEPAKAEAIKAETAKAEALSRTPRDGIGEIIKAGDAKGAETTASVASPGSPTIAQAQRALVKLGYGPLKADGLMGAGTRAAIEKFERDRKLPVKGEPSAQTLRELAARAGVTRG